MSDIPDSQLVTGDKIYLPEVVVTPDEKQPEGSGYGYTTFAASDLPESLPYIPPKPKAATTSTPSKPTSEAKPLPESLPYIKPPTKEEKAAARAAEPVGVLPNIGAGLAEGAAPGVAHAVATPVDLPVNLVKGAAKSIVGAPYDIEALAKDAGSLFGWSTPEDVKNVEERRKAALSSIDEAIPSSPLGSYLTRQINNFSGGWIPTPENPIASIPARTEQEKMARRAAQVASQTALTTLASKGVGKIPLPGPEPLTAGILAAPRFMGSTPTLSTGLIAGGASLAGQYAGQKATEAGFSPEAARSLEIGTGLASALPIGLGVAAAKYPFSTWLPEVGASGWLGKGIREKAERGLAGDTIRKSGPGALAEGGTWNESQASVRDALENQLTAQRQAATSQERQLQSQADTALARIGGTSSDLQSRLNAQQSAMDSELSQMNIAPVEAGKQIKSGMGKILKKEGPLSGILDKDPKTKQPIVIDSAVPKRVFNEKLTPEDFTSMFHQATKGFREAYQNIGLANFLESAAKRDSAGKIVGIDLKKAENWQSKYKTTLDNAEDAANRLWGADAAKYSIRDKVGLAIERQKGIDSLNAQRDGLLKSIGTGGLNSPVVTSVWKEGAAGGDSVKSYLNLAKNDPDAVNNLIDMAAADLRNFATKNGVFQPKLAENWISSHTDAIDQLPAGIRDRFKNAGEAQALVDAHVEQRAAAIKQFQEGAAKGYLNGKSPVEAIRDIFADKTQRPEVAIRDLSNKLRPDAAAHDGLKRDFMQFAVDEAKKKVEATPAHGFAWLREKISGPHAANENSVQLMDNIHSFLKENQASVRELYGDNATNHMMAMLRNKPLGYAKPGSVGALIVGVLGSAALTDFGSYAAFNVLQHATSSFPRTAAVVTAGALAKATIDKLRSSGIRNVNDFLAESMSNPRLMRELSKSATDNTAWNRAIRQIAVIGTDEAMGGYGIGEKAKR